MTGRRSDPATLGTDHVPRLREGVVVLPVGDESVLFEEESGMLHQLDVTATLVCGCFDGETSIDELVDDLAEAFGTDRSVIEADVLGMLRELGRKGLLEGVEGEASGVEDPDVEASDPS